jgi:hypothetical protein
MGPPINSWDLPSTALDPGYGVPSLDPGASMEQHPQQLQSSCWGCWNIGAWDEATTPARASACAGGRTRQRRPSDICYIARPTLLIFGKTISGTDARIGRSRLPKPLTVAGITKKKIINMACASWGDSCLLNYDYLDTAYWILGVRV